MLLRLPVHHPVSDPAPAARDTHLRLNRGRMKLRVAAFAVFAGLGAHAGAQRLSTNVQPQHYTLALTPDIGKATFAGEETIDIVLAAPARAITLNALELKLLSASASGPADKPMPGTVSYDEKREQATLTFPAELPAGRSSLHIAFTGVLNDKLHGFYLSRTKARHYAVTQFESTDARRAFPSFDEPAFKATFDIALTVDQRDTAISNMNVTADKPAGDGRHTLVFATTPRMSTYLVAFLVGDFACSKGKADGIAIRVCSTPDKVKLTKFAVDAAEHYLKYYDSYFGIKYPLPKLDLIGIPDFEAGAMENFGAITYRETELLVDEKDGSENAKKRVAVTVAHEMAHQWFGDLVTMQWWNNLWLNEGFATWMENKAAAAWHPEWHFAEDTAADLNDTLNYDAVRTTRTIRADADTPSEIEEMFDGIAYGKAGAVIGMVENWLGPEVFRQGVHNYLAAHLYANATAEDFWNAQTATSKKPVDVVMRSFVDRPGVPLLRFADSQPLGIPVTEQRFFLDGEQADDRQGQRRLRRLDAAGVPQSRPGGQGCGLPRRHCRHGGAGGRQRAVPVRQRGRGGLLPGGLLSRPGEGHRGGRGDGADGCGTAGLRGRSLGAHACRTRLRGRLPRPRPGTHRRPHARGARRRARRRGQGAQPHRHARRTRPAERPSARAACAGLRGIPA